MLLTRLLTASAVALFLVTACYKPPPAATAQPATKPSPPPTETVNIDFALDLGAFEPRTLGVFRPKPSVEPPLEILSTLRPLLSDQIPVLISVNQKAKFDGAFPGQNGKWDKWEKEVRALMSSSRAEGRPILWEIWDEPDNRNSFKGNQAEFFTTWIHTWRILKSADPDAQIIGPSTSKHDGGWIQEFLKVCKENAVPPTIVSWHQDTLKSEMPGNITGKSEEFWQDGFGHNRILVSNSGRIARDYAASDIVMFLAQVHKAHFENAWRGVDERWLFKLSHLVDKDQSPRSNAFAYQAYAKLFGRIVKLSSSSTVDGIAIWDHTAQRATIILGRNKNRSSTNRAKLPELFLSMKNLPGSAAEVSIQPIPNSGDKPLESLPAPATQRFDTSSGELRIPLTLLADREVNVISLTLAGQPSAATKPTSRPSPGGNTLVPPPPLP